MDNQKVENILNVSLETEETEREKSPSLSTGYNSVQKTWEIIVRFTGDIELLRERYPQIDIKPLLNNYAIINATQTLIDSIADEDMIEYIEKPKPLYFQISNGKAISCINSVQQGVDNIYNLFGEGVITAVIDTGINIMDREFRNSDGSTRILNIWDQSNDEELDKIQIDEAIISGILIETGRDSIGHGTDVAHIACGNSGVAPLSDIIVVKMGIGSRDGFPRTTELMEALDYVIKKGIEYKKPVAVNISFGNNYGDHTGNSLLEKYIDDIANAWKCSICIGTGNEGLGSTHIGGVLKDDEENVIELIVEEYETSIDIQIWKNFWDDFRVEIVTPAGVSLGYIENNSTVKNVSSGRTTVLTFFGEPSPYSVRQEIFISIIPKDNVSYIDSGIWKLRLVPDSIVAGNFDIWLPAIGSLNEGTGFAESDGDFSITVPATSRYSISVGAYDSRTNSYAPFSGRGFVVNDGAFIFAKPDIVAPGVEIMVGNGRRVTGTSFATPFVTGGAALLMEWGIVRGNDPYLYGEKLKSYFIKGARQLPGMNTPNQMTGWGALCVRGNLPI